MKTLLNQIPADNRKIREFGIVMFVVVGLLIPAFLLWRNDWEATSWTNYLFTCSAVFLISTLTLPRAFYLIYRLWMLLALGLGFVVTRIIITLVYLLLMTPIGFIRRQNKTSVYRTFLDFDPDKHSTYWIRRNEKWEKEHAERQF